MATKTTDKGHPSHVAMTKELETGSLIWFVEDSIFENPSKGTDELATSENEPSAFVVGDSYFAKGNHERQLQLQCCHHCLWYVRESFIRSSLDGSFFDSKLGRSKAFLARKEAWCPCGKWKHDEKKTNTLKDGNTRSPSFAKDS